MQIGAAVYSYAKLRMFEFWEVIYKYILNDYYQLTDSLYITFAKPTIDECVNPILKEEWLREEWNWFSVSQDSIAEQVQFQGQEVPLTQWDMRTPGTFKAEFSADGMIASGCK